MDGRAYVSGSYLLELGGVPCGFLKSVEGGAIIGEVINQPSGNPVFPKKCISQPKYEHVTILFGLSMNKALYEWISETLMGGFPRRDVAVVACDAKLQPRSRTEYTHCLITEVAFPALDGASKEPAYLRITFAPESTRVGAAPGKVSAEASKAEAKALLPSNFALSIPGLDASRVSKIGEIVVKVWGPPADVGGIRIGGEQPSHIEFSNLVVTMPESAAETWGRWHNDFLVAGNNDDAAEKTGTISGLNANRQAELFTITLRNLGILRLSADKAEANADQIKRVQAEMYCERIEFSYKGAGAK